MMRLHIVLIAFISLQAVFALCQAETDRKYEKTENLIIPCQCQLIKSRVVGSESGEDNCRIETKNVFVFKGNTEDFNKLHDKVILIDSWDTLKEVKNKYLRSSLLDGIKRADFSRYEYAVILVVFGGLINIENERLEEKDGRPYFAYDIWKGQSEMIPACIEERLYLLKLRKKGF